MPSEEAEHVSPMEVTPRLGKATLDTWRFLRQGVAGLIKPAQRSGWLATRLRVNQEGQGRMRTSA